MSFFKGNFISRLCDAILVTFILLNITVLFLNTFKEVEKKSTDIGKLIGEIEKNYGVDIVIILRDGVIILATDEVRAKLGDTLIYREKK